MYVCFGCLNWHPVQGLIHSLGPPLHVPIFVPDEMLAGCAIA